MAIEYHETALTFGISHNLRYTILGWDTDEHVDVIRTCIGLYNLYSFLLA